jgi:hypothetical protein
MRLDLKELTALIDPTKLEFDAAISQSHSGSIPNRK